VHFELISAATVALAFRVYALRRVVAEHTVPIVGSTLWASSSSLLLTPLVGRLSGLAPALCYMLSQRSVTTPFALAGAATLG
jgi:putative effector of murein hydrolase